MTAKTIIGDTLNSVIRQAFKYIKDDGILIDTRNGSALTVFNPTFILTNPRARHLYIPGRKSNIFQLMAETLWVLDGNAVVKDHLEFFLPRALNYSDDGQTWHGAYGPRLEAHRQLEGLVKIFQSEGVTTRRAVVMIADPEKDSAYNLLEKGIDRPRDICCNRELHFYVDPRVGFCLKVIQRSGDMLFGAGSINPFEFTVIQELVYNSLRSYGLLNDVSLGHYIWTVTNAHVYSAFEGQLNDVCDFDEQLPEYAEKEIGASGYLDSYKTEGVYWALLTDLMISCHDNVSVDTAVHLFNEHALSGDTDLLQYYMLLAMAHFLSVRFKSELEASGSQLTITLPADCPMSLTDAVVNSTFRKFVVSDDVSSEFFKAEVLQF